MKTRPVPAGLVALVMVAACSPSTPASSAPAPSASASVDGAGNLPPGCEPIDLSSPDGDRIVLDGTWTEAGTEGQLMTWWIRTQGDCVWGAGQIDDVPPATSFSGRPDQVQSLIGHLGLDSVITGEIFSLGPVPLGQPPPYSALRMFVEFDDSGEILLREDREPGVFGPRCPDPGGYCPAPLVLQPLDQ